MKVKSESEVTQLYPTLSDLMDCSPPGSSIHGIFLARALEWVAIAFSEQMIKKLGWTLFKGHRSRGVDWSFSFNISPSNEHPRLISSRMDWLDLLTVQGTLKGLQLIKGALINMPLETWGYKGRKCNLREGVTIF